LIKEKPLGQSIGIRFGFSSIPESRIPSIILFQLYDFFLRQKLGPLAHEIKLRR